MSDGPSSGGTEFDAFLRRMEQDLREATPRPRDEYQAMFPGAADRIRQEYGPRLDGLFGPASSVDAGVELLPGDGIFSEATEDGAGQRESLLDPEFGPYRLVRELGRGGQAIVYLAEETGLKRLVALKILERRGPAGASVLQRFQREAEVTARLDHPAICPVFGSGVHNGNPYIAMRHVEGETLAQKIARARSVAAEGTAPGTAGSDGPLNWRGVPDRNMIRSVLRFAEKAAGALGFAHEAGVVHRDIKPGNIMVTAGGDPVILDFGLARAAEEGVTALTLSGQVFGTLHYMSPEQVRGESKLVDRRTDVYSMGATLFEALTLLRPFDELSGEALRQAILGDEPSDPRRSNAAIGADLAVVLMTALDRDPGRRYATAADLARDLRNVVEHRPIEARPPSVLTRLLRFVRRRRGALTAAGLAVAVILAAVSMWILFSAPSAAPATGTRRLKQLISDVVVEHSDVRRSGTPVWNITQFSSDGTITLPVGAYKLRARRKGHFPWILAEPVQIRKDESADISFISRPIEWWSSHIGEVRSRILVLRRDLRPSELIIRTSEDLHQFQAISGKRAGFPPHETTSTTVVHWVARHSPSPVIVSFKPFPLGVTAIDLVNPVLWWKDPTDAGPIRRVDVVGDVDGDKTEDVAFVTEDDSLWVCSGATGEILWARDGGGHTWRVLGHVRGRNGDAAGVLLIDSEGRLVMLDPKTGREIFEAKVNASVQSMTAVDPEGRESVLVLQGQLGAWLLQLGAGGSPHVMVEGGPVQIVPAEVSTPHTGREIVVASEKELSVWTRSGERLWGATLPGKRSSLAAGDLDGRLGDEIVSGDADGFVRAFSGRTLEELWEFDVRSAVSFPPVVEDLNGDGIAEVVVTSAGGYVYVLRGSPDGRLWTADTPWAIGGVPVMVRQNGHDPLIVVGGAGSGAAPFNTAMSGPSIHGIDARSGTENWKQMAEMAFLWCPDVADLNGDGDPDTLAQDRIGKLRGFCAWDGRPTFEYEGVGEYVMTAPRLSDLDGDGKVEIVFSELRKDRRNLVALNPRTKVELWRHDDTWVKSLWRIEIGDIGSDGKSEVICGVGGEVVVCDSRTGNVVNRLLLRDRKSRVESPAVIADVDGDGVNDLVVATLPREPAPGELVVFFGPDLTKTWTAATYGMDSRPALADVNGDGTLDFVCTEWDSTVRAYDGRTGSVIWKEPVDSEAIYSSPRIADLDRDGTLEVVVGLKSNSVCILDAKSGTVLRRIGTEAPVWGTALLEDLDGDGLQDIIIGADDGRLHAIPGRRR